MAFPERHKLLTFVGKLYSTSENFSFSMRIIPDIAHLTVDQAQVDALAAPITTWFSAVNTAIPALHFLQSIKLAPIGTDGHYPAGEDSVEHFYAGAGVAGGGVTTQTWPPQCTVAMSLLTAATRGIGHTGRFYLPPLASLLGADAKLPAAVVNPLLATTRTLLLAINATANVGTVGVITKTGISGSSRVVTGLRCGRVVDTQRRRRRSIDESYLDLVL